MNPVLRHMTAAELPMVLDWAAAEGWNPGLDDARPFHAADPQGFFIAEADGAPVAAISVVNHDADFAFLGLYLCQPEWRGRGIGLALWNHALAHAGDRSIGLDGVAAQQENYARSGFVLTGSTTRFTGSLAAQGSASVAPAQAEDFEALHRLDQLASGMDRAAFLRAWTTQAASRRTVLHRSDGHIDGFATLRLCREGCKIGPIIAPDAATALRLARAALSELGAGPVIIDLPQQAKGLARMLGDLGFSPGFTTARMFRGTPPQQGAALQAVASMELG